VITIDIASEREKEWADREMDLTPDGYDFSTWEETRGDIPETFFNRFCSTKQLKQDVTDFVKRQDVQEIIEKLK
jgi:hypothetical protein